MNIKTPVTLKPSHTSLPIRLCKALGGGVIFFFLLALPGTASAEFALGAAADVVHSEGTYGVTARYDYRPLRLGSHAIVWHGPDGTNGALAAELNLGFWVFDLGVGGAYIARTGEINGTKWTFSLSGAVNLGDHWRAYIYHFSNGKKVFGWAQDDHNAGWNFVGLAYRF